jgi:hypothetical protein
MKGTLLATTRLGDIRSGHNKYRRLRAGWPAAQNSPLKG